MKGLLLLLAAASSLACPAAAFAADGHINRDVYMRAGPGKDYPVAATLRAGDRIAVSQCSEPRSWCKVESADTPGWVYSSYVSLDTEDAARAEPAALSQAAAVDELTTGSIAPAPEATAFVLPDEVRRYVATHRPLSIRSELAVGAVLPEGARPLDIPGYPYQYVYVDERPVLVDRTSRRVVYMVR
jgi:uncharacterized protein YgiM (DUF1202 family)